MLGAACGLMTHCYAHDGDAEVEDLWGKAFSWYRTGKSMADAGAPPLALGSYIESLTHFGELQHHFPDYEKEIIDFRAEAIQEEVESIQATLTPDDRNILIDFIDFIESLKQGEEQRFSGESKSEALSTLRYTRELLNKVKKDRPEPVTLALANYENRLDDGIDWLNKQIEHQNRLMKPGVNQTILKATGKDRFYGTTKFLSAEDLPDEPGGLPSGDLFPPMTAVQFTP
ncbi:MAG: hypothetical protein AAF226_07025 [Verrucomicrobiota bacterium]